jgi:2-polyprenyl-6-methoxyphenol hydroxylase-like FAD-dependent oxidoreductase
MNNSRRHAVVLGGSIAGLLAARVLSEQFEEVTLVERDTLPSGPDSRKGVPQDRQLHGFLAGGVAALEELFPGFIERMRQRGAEYIDVARVGFFTIGGVPLPSYDSGVRGLLASRPLLEAQVRELVLARPNVTLRDGWVAKGLSAKRRRVEGVRLAPRDQPHLEETLPSDLVVDATGRGSRFVAWLTELGFARPREEIVRANLTSSTCTIRRRKDHLGGQSGFVISATPPSLRSGAALAIEGDRYIVSMTTYLGEPPPKTYEEMIEFARTLPVRGLYELLCDAEPLSELAIFRDKESRRRYCEELQAFPDGFLVLGDALCNFNPLYGQGVTVAAREAQVLATWLQQRAPARTFFRAAAKLLDAPWSTIVSGDLQWPGVEGKRSAGSRVLNGYMERLMCAAGRDRETATALLRVIHLLAPPTSLFAPKVVASALLRGQPFALPGVAPA